MIFCPLIKQQCFVEKADEEGRDDDTCMLWDCEDAECTIKHIGTNLDILASHIEDAGVHVLIDGGELNTFEQNNYE